MLWTCLLFSSDGTQSFQSSLYMSTGSEVTDCEIVPLKSDVCLLSLVTSHTHTHSNTHTHTCVTPTLLAPSVAHEIKVLMSSAYQQMPSWPCHRWLAWSQRRGLTASPFKGSSPATTSPQIPSLSISLCYIYYLHLDNILSDRSFFPFKVKLQWLWNHQPLE